MKRFFFVVALISTCAALAWGAPKLWLFKTEAEMQKVIPKHINNPRATFYVIMRAHHRNLAGQATVVYHKLMKKKPEEPKLWAAYAFSHFMATGPLSREYFVRGASPLTVKLREQYAEADYYRTQALKVLPNSPETLVETALPLLHKSGQRPKSVEYLRKAVQLAPQWSDAHYWLGYALNGLWVVVPKGNKRVAIGQEAIAAFKKAEKLDPALHKECLYGYVHAYQGIGQPGPMLKALDAYIKVVPKYGGRPDIIKWRESLVKQVQQKGS